MRGGLLSWLGFQDEAIQALQEVLRLDPTVIPAQIELGTLFLARGDAATAISYASSTCIMTIGPSKRA